MDRIERVQRVLEGRRPDRSPVSFWYHFPADQVCGRAAVEAHVAHLEAFDLDFLKVMNDNGYPHDTPIDSTADLASLTVLHGDEPTFVKQLDLLADLVRRLGDRVLLTTTLFNAYTTLRQLLAPPKSKHMPPNMDGSADPRTQQIRRFLADDPLAVKTAIRTIGSGLANFARYCMEAGADGVFMSVRDDWLDSAGGEAPAYDDLVRASDLDILAGASGGRLNMLHVCGKAVNFDAFAVYPVHAINWADRAAGPAIGEVCDRLKPAVCGGVDNLSTMPRGTPADCGREALDALQQAKERPIMIAPGCTFDPQIVPQSNLKAICRAVRQ